MDGDFIFLQLYLMGVKAQWTTVARRYWTAGEPDCAYYVKNLHCGYGGGHFHSQLSYTAHFLVVKMMFYDCGDTAGEMMKCGL